jgi:hypothetical protein
MILVFYFQFPDETENTQSPPAKKNGNHNIVIRYNEVSRKKTKESYIILRAYLLKKAHRTNHAVQIIKCSVYKKIPPSGGLCWITSFREVVQRKNPENPVNPV